MSTLENNVVIVTGASEGIGRALSLALAARGARLALAARNAQRLEDLASACRETGGEAIVVPTDIGDESACRQLVDATVAHYGRLDSLVNNAGATMWSRFEEIDSLEVFGHLMQINLLGSVYCTAYALPHLRKSAGRLVAVTSLAGLTGVPERTAYAASKHAMTGFFDSLRVELIGSGVTVTVVAPDFVVSQIHRRAIGPDGQPLGETPMQEAKIMTAEECAAQIVRAMEKRERLRITSLRGRVGRWIKLVAPAMIDRIAAAAIRERR